MINSRISSDDDIIADDTDIMPLEERQMLEIIETRWIKKNKDMQQIISKLIEPNETFEQNDLLLEFIQSNDWRSVDAYMIENEGIRNFFQVIEQLFYFFYIVKIITLKQFQNAMGIQQVRWMIDSTRPPEDRKMSGYNIKSAEFLLWENNTLGQSIHISMCEHIKNSMYYPSPPSPPPLPDFLNNTVWYRVQRSNVSSVRSRGGVLFFGGISIVGDDFLYYPIPETLNFSEITCMYRPRLIFGSLKDLTLTNFILDNNERPYAAHIPMSTTNLVKIHDEKHMIVSNWWHDFIHGRGATCDVNKNIKMLNKSCNDVFKVGDDTNFDKIKHCVNVTTPNNAVWWNDNGFPFKVILNSVASAEGTKRRKRKRIKKTKSKRRKLLITKTRK